MGQQFGDSESLPKTVLDYSGICWRELAEILIRSELTELSISALHWILILLLVFVDLCCVLHVLQVNDAVCVHMEGCQDWIIQLSLWSVQKCDSKHPILLTPLATYGKFCWRIGIQNWLSDSCHCNESEHLALPSSLCPRNPRTLWHHSKGSDWSPDGCPDWSPSQTLMVNHCVTDILNMDPNPPPHHFKHK